MSAVQSRYPDALIQFEDFLTPNAYALLNKYRSGCCVSTTTSRAPPRSAGRRLLVDPDTGSGSRDLNIMFLGAGSAATGIADLMTAAFVDEGLTAEEARRHLSFVDMNGLVVKIANGPDGAQPAVRA